MATTTPYANFIIEDKIKSVLTTQLNMQQFVTVDFSLQASAGMIKKVHVYNSTGSAEDLAQGSGNTQSIAPQWDEAVYTVIETQARFPYYDEQAMADPSFIEAGIKGMAEAMTNDITAKVVGELAKANLGKAGVTWALNDFIDALALYPYEDEANLFFLINPATKAAVRKSLKDELKYVEDFARTGYIGHIMGVPVFISKAVPEGYAYLATKEAVTLFTKKAVETESERNANTRLTTLYTRQPRVIALTDATRVVVMDAGTYTLTSDQSVQSSKTYYTQDAGGAFHPVASPKTASISTYYERA